MFSSENSLIPLQSTVTFSNSIFCTLSDRVMSSAELQICLLVARDDCEAWESRTATSIGTELS